MQGERGGRIAQIGKSVCVSALITLAAVLVFALFVKWFSFGSNVILPVNQVIKLTAIAVGAIVCIKGEKPVLNGALAGLLTTVVTYFIFAAIAGEITFGWGNVADGLFGALAGAIGGALSALLRK